MTLESVVLIAPNEMAYVRRTRSVWHHDMEEYALSDIQVLSPYTCFGLNRALPHASTAIIIVCACVPEPNSLGGLCVDISKAPTVASRGLESPLGAPVTTRRAYGRS